MGLFSKKKEMQYPPNIPMDMPMDNPASPENVEGMEQVDNLRDFVNFPMPEEKQGIFQFFNKVIETDDTSKVGNLNEHELEAVRLYQGLALYANTMGLDIVADHMVNEGEVMLSTSDSKTGFLIRSVITSRKEWKGSEGEKKEKKGWFGKQKAESGEQ
jgi:hypothetical protein